MSRNLLVVLFNIMKAVLFLLLFVVTVVKSEEKKDRNVDRINFLLYTRVRRTNPMNFSIHNVPQEARRFRKAFYIVHGWNRSPQMKEIQDLKEAILKRKDAAVILVDWEHLASNWWYPSSAASTLTVATKMALIWEWSKKKHPSIYIWCVGHSLGAHACGFAGKAYKIDQVTGLDPPSIGFQSYEQGLNYKSADFVQVIHTTALAGTFLPRGHADFYPNGGHFQPHCTFTDAYCNHEYGIVYFAESFKKDMAFDASQCRRFVLHLWRCKSCTNCRMGFPADPQTRGIYYVNPYIQEHKEVE